MLRCCPSSWSRFHPWFPRPPPRRTNIKHPSRRLDAQTSNIRAAAPTSTNLNDKNGANICIWLSKATPPRRMRRSRQRRRSERSELGISPGEPIRHGVERGSTTMPQTRKMAPRCHRCWHKPRSGKAFAWSSSTNLRMARLHDQIWAPERQDGRSMQHAANALIEAHQSASRITSSAAPLATSAETPPPAMDPRSNR